MFYAKYPGKCSQCGQRFEAGAPVKRPENRAYNGRGWAHALCPFVVELDEQTRARLDNGSHSIVLWSYNEGGGDYDESTKAGR